MTSTNQLSASEASSESNRRFAGQALERASERMRDLGFGAKEIANKSLHSITDSAHAAQRQLGQYASTTGRYVAEQPLKSALIAAAIGAAVAGLILAIRHNRNSHL
jgi:ElaB/YqjD/DUF883 family membrane-anchored ribosome-binding protein